VALFINRWSRPYHVFALDEGEAVAVYGPPARHEASEAAGDRALCGIGLDAANSQGRVDRDTPHVLRVSRVGHWPDLHAFCLEDALCEACRGRLPDVWPPAREYQHPTGDWFLARTGTFG
jgi:hypothetical protein